MSGLTKRQAEAFAFIQSFIASKGYSPSYREIADALGVASKSDITRMVDQLEQRGAIGRLPGRSRSLFIKAAA